MAVTLGLIANEVILNSLKHAFSGRQSGTMGVELNDGSQRVMVVYDDGNGLPDGFDPKKATGLGLELVLGLSRQIHGEASIANRPSGGSCTTIRFPATSAGTQTETQIPKAQTPCPPNASSLSKTKPSPQSPSSVS
jgi:two-component sensor histidine kinase